MLYLHGLGHFYPDNVITNRFLEELDIGTNDEWILERVGIRTRRTALPLDYIRETKNRDPRAALEAATCLNSASGAAAARMALERAGLKPADIGLVVSGSSAPDTVTPAEAAAVATELGIEAPCFDINSACTSFGVQIHFLLGMKPEALPPFILVVNPESLTRVVDYSDRNSAVLFGDGSSAAVVSATVPAPPAFVLSHADSKPSAWDKVTIPRTGYFQQDGNVVQGFAIRKTTESLRELKLFSGVNSDRFRFVGHQANLGMLETVCERACIKKDNHWHNVEDYGNTGCSGAPAVLSQHWEELKPGMHVAIALVGGGLTWAHLLLKVGDRL
ncbi:MAG: ketoacyl-ACP synthase III [Syntrophobacterales bacterium]|nr:ketoacyl-ACP synthase III [Syntrophobacterales bacterium]